MKKAVSVLMAFVLVFSVFGCGTDDKIEKRKKKGTAEVSGTYVHDEAGFLNTDKNVYINLGDSKSDVETLLGSGVQSDITSFYEYSDNLSVLYDDNNRVEYLMANYFNDCEYELPCGINGDSAIADFAKNYKHVYLYDISANGVKSNNNQAAVLQEKDGKCYVLSREELLDINEETWNNEHLFMIDIRYNDRNIWCITLHSLTSYHDAAYWNNSLLDLNESSAKASAKPTSDTSAKSSSYDADYVGIYDNVTKKKFAIGESKTTIDAQLGAPDSTGEYADDCTVFYDSKNKSWYYSVFYDSVDGKTSRYTLPNGIGEGDLAKKFVNAFPHAYAYDLTGNASKNCMSIGIIVRNVNGSYQTITKEELIAVKESEWKNEDFFIVSVNCDLEPDAKIWGLTVKGDVYYEDADHWNGTFMDLPF